MTEEDKRAISAFIQRLCPADRVIVIALPDPYLGDASIFANISHESTLTVIKDIAENVIFEDASPIDAVN